MTERVTPTEIVNIAETMRQTVEDLDHVELLTQQGLDPFRGDLDLGRAVLASIPKGREVQDLGREIRAAFETIRPIRRTGTAQLQTLESLVGWANRFKGDGSVLFANPDRAKPSLTCIANYHLPGPAEELAALGDKKAAHGDHRGHYAFPLSKEWKNWTKVSDTPLEKDELGFFIEDNAKDLLDPTPYLTTGAGDDPAPWEQTLAAIARKIGGRFGTTLDLMTISRQFQVNESSNLSVTSNRDTGAATIQFVDEHNDPEGNPIRIPNLFLIAIPVFESGTVYRLPVRFLYRKKGQTLRFFLSIYDPDKAIDDAFDGAVNEAEEKTGLPLFLGSPE